MVFGVKKSSALFYFAVGVLLMHAAEVPQAVIENGRITARLYLPDAKAGYYRGTRFDWSGVVASLVFAGHDYYGPWFRAMDPNVHDYTFDGAEVVASPCSAIMGPVEEFQPLGWDDAPAGGNFIKIGIGALRKEGSRYDHYKLYDMPNPGKWDIVKKRDSVEFTQMLDDPSSGYGYVYRKTVRLESGRPVMFLEHSLKNTGRRPIRTTVYDHNFLVLDHRPTGPDFTITVPFQIESRRPPQKDLAEIRGNRVVYLRELRPGETAATPLNGFGDTSKDYDIRIENAAAGAGMRITADRPLSSASLWSIRPVVSVEPFIAIDIEPGGEFTWRIRYEYSSLPPAER
jgi:hypothetical protein